MKKNILTIIVMALATINVILTAVVVFTMVPAMNRTNNLINEISQMVELELEKSEKDKNATVSFYDTELHTFPTEPSSITINLKKGDDGAAHYAVFDQVTVTINKNADDYKELAEVFDGRSSDVMAEVTRVIRGYTNDTILANQDTLTNDCVKKLQDFFDTEAITNVTFNNLRIQ